MYKLLLNGENWSKNMDVVYEVQKDAVWKGDLLDMYQMVSAEYYWGKYSMLEGNHNLGLTKNSWYTNGPTRMAFIKEMTCSFIWACVVNQMIA